MPPQLAFCGNQHEYDDHSLSKRGKNNLGKDSQKRDFKNEIQDKNFPFIYIDADPAHQSDQIQNQPVSFHLCLKPVRQLFHL